MPPFRFSLKLLLGSWTIAIILFAMASAKLRNDGWSYLERVCSLPDGRVYVITVHSFRNPFRGEQVWRVVARAPHFQTTNSCSADVATDGSGADVVNARNGIFYLGQKAGDRGVYVVGFQEQGVIPIDLPTSVNSDMSKMSCDELLASKVWRDDVLPGVEAVIAEGYMRSDRFFQQRLLQQSRPAQ